MLLDGVGVGGALTGTDDLIGKALGDVVWMFRRDLGSTCVQQQDGLNHRAGTHPQPAASCPCASKAC